VRPARPLPYTLLVDGHVAGSSATIDFRNSGGAAAVFQVRSTAHDPRVYTVERGKNVSDTWTYGSGYDLSVYGPNGFFRHFKGGQQAILDVRARYEEGEEVSLTVRNRGTERVSVTLTNRYGSPTTTLSLKPGDAKTQRWSLERTHGWYDVVVTVDKDPGFEYRYAGHVENGRGSISDPGMAGLI
jgi:phospholipase C